MNQMQHNHTIISMLDTHHQQGEGEGEGEGEGRGVVCDSCETQTAKVFCHKCDGASLCDECATKAHDSKVSTNDPIAFLTHTVHAVYDAHVTPALNQYTLISHIQQCVRVQLGRSHTPVPIASKSLVWCSDHNQHIMLYCNTCTKPVCQMCFFVADGTCKAHAVVTVNEMAEQHKASTQTIVAELRQMHTEINKRMEQVDDMMKGWSLGVGSADTQ